MRMTVELRSASQAKADLCESQEDPRTTSSEGRSLAGFAANWGRRSSAAEADLLREAIRALMGIRYGAVILTVHDGRLVEVHRTERFRRKAGAQRE